MKNYISKSDVTFCGVFSGLFTWSNALSLPSFGGYELLFILWNYLLNFVVLTVLLYLITLFLKRPVFGRIKAYYFPFGTMVIVSLVATALFALINYIGDKQPMTPRHILIYVFGYLANAALLLLYFYIATKKDNSKK